MSTQNGVIETSTGDLIRASMKPYDFVNDGGLDSAIETVRTDVPFPATIRGGSETTHDRWTGTEWIKVANPPFPSVPIARLSSSVNQIPSDTNPAVITYNTQDEIEGITHSTSVNPGEITIQKTGAYWIMPQPQVGKFSGGIKVDFDMFLQINRGSGFVDEPNTNIKLIAKDADVTDVIVSGFPLNLKRGDKFRMMQRVSTTQGGCGLISTDPIVGPPSIPRTPSIIFTMFGLGGF